MIALVYFQSPFCVVSLVFYTCILMPLFRLKNAVLGTLGKEAEESCHHMEVEPYLSVFKYGEQDQEQHSSSSSSSAGENMCSICLVELEKEDVMSRLSRCGHVFHRDCIDKWLDCNHFTCPLCRSFLLVNLHSSHAKCITTATPTTLFC